MINIDSFKDMDFNTLSEYQIFFVIYQSNISIWYENIQLIIQKDKDKSESIIKRYSLMKEKAVQQLHRFIDSSDSDTFWKWYSFWKRWFLSLPLKILENFNSPEIEDFLPVTDWRGKIK